MGGTDRVEGVLIPAQAKGAVSSNELSAPGLEVHRGKEMQNPHYGRYEHDLGLTRAKNTMNIADEGKRRFCHGKKKKKRWVRRVAAP